MSDMLPWMQTLVEIVAGAMTAHGPIGPLGLRYRWVDDLWDILIYPLPLEMVGGAHDGGLAAPNFSLDLQYLLSAFAPVHDVRWNAYGLDTVDSPCISIEGDYQGEAVWLRILAFAPEDVGPGLKVDANERA
jgi:hypothetical protein